MSSSIPATSTAPHCLTAASHIAWGIAREPVCEAIRMEDEGKAKKQLISEVVEMRQCDAALNATETECRQARAALRESEAKFRRVYA